MDIRVGADVVGKDGKLGEVDKVIVDARSDKVTDLVVKHGGLFGGRERVVPLGHVTGVEGDAVRVDLDKRDFDTMDGFTDDRYHSPDPNYIGPPGFERRDFLVDTYVAAGAAGGFGIQGKPMGYPGGDDVGPDDQERPTLAEGMVVMDKDGEKIGSVGGFSFDATHGAITHFSVKHGGLFSRENTELPIEWLAEVSADGVLLNVAKDEVERRH